MLSKAYLRQRLHNQIKAIVIVTIALNVVGCKSPSGTSNSYVGEQQAIAAALESASTSRPEISGPQEKPSNINAQKMTLAEAVKKINKNNQPASEYDPKMTVWFVTMDGLWLGEMSAPGDVPAPEPVPYHHYAIIIDAKTGSEIESSLSP